MAVVYREWLNSNEARSYPVSDTASLVTSDGKRLPDDIIVDCNIWVPSTLGNVIYIGAVTVSSSIASVVFVCRNTTTGIDTPVAAISAVKPFKIFQNYQLESLVDGVKGWVMLGHGVNNPTQLSFSDYTSTMLVSRVVRTYVPRPVTSIAKKGVYPRLTGVVNLEGVSGLVTVQEGVRHINGSRETVLLIGLDMTSNPVNTLLNYSGPCSGRPASGTCSKTPLTEINGVSPDPVTGNISLIFTGDILIGDAGDGLILESPVDLDTLCGSGLVAPLDANTCKATGSV